MTFYIAAQIFELFHDWIELDAALAGGWCNHLQAMLDFGIWSKFGIRNNRSNLTIRYSVTIRFLWRNKIWARKSRSFVKHSMLGNETLFTCTSSFLVGMLYFSHVFHTSLMDQTKSDAVAPPLWIFHCHGGKNGEMPHLRSLVGWTCRMGIPSSLSQITRCHVASWN